MPYKIVIPKTDIITKNLCQKPYPDHPKGCPNYNKKLGCPPDVPHLSKMFNLNKTIYVIWNMFDFYKHCQRMKSLHPEWSERQVQCCLYWQGKARKQLRNETYKFRQDHPNSLILYPPEAYGINVTGTMKTLGIKLEWPPVNFTYQIAITQERE